MALYSVVKQAQANMPSPCAGRVHFRGLSAKACVKCLHRGGFGHARWRGVPAQTMLGFSSVPSSRTWWSLSACAPPRRPAQPRHAGHRGALRASSAAHPPCLKAHQGHALGCAVAHVPRAGPCGPAGVQPRRPRRVALPHHGRAVTGVAQGDQPRGRGRHLVARRQHRLGNRLAGLDGVAAVGQDLWLHDRHQAVLLADLGVARKPVRVLVGCLARRARGRARALNCSPAWRPLARECRQGGTVQDCPAVSTGNGLSTIGTLRSSL